MEKIIIRHDPKTINRNGKIYCRISGYTGTYYNIEALKNKHGFVLIYRAAYVEKEYATENPYEIEWTPEMEKKLLENGLAETYEGVYNLFRGILSKHYPKANERFASDYSDFLTKQYITYGAHERYDMERLEAFIDKHGNKIYDFIEDNDYWLKKINEVFLGATE